MITIKENSALIGVAELRTRTSEALRMMKQNRVILTKRNKPVGILIDYEEFLKMEKILEEVEDLVLGQIAQKRVNRKNIKMVSLKEAEKRVGLK